MRQNVCLRSSDAPRVTSLCRSCLSTSSLITLSSLLLRLPLDILMSPVIMESTIGFWIGSVSLGACFGLLVSTTSQPLASPPLFGASTLMTKTHARVGQDSESSEETRIINPES